MTRIIRASGRSTPRRPNPERTRVLRAGQLDALRAGEEELASARRQARSILEQASAEAAELRRRAEEESHIRAAAILCRAEERAAQIALEAREELTTLATRIAEKILGEQLRLHPESVCSIVAQCLRACGGPRRVRLRINPEDLPLIERELPHIGNGSTAVQLQPDPTVSRGGCLIESELGQVDGRLETQLARLREALR